MNREFALPIALAAALHGAVLFGFNDKEPRQTPPKPPKVDPMVIAIRPPPDEPDVVPETGERSREKAPPAAPDIPRRAEPLTVDIKAAFEIPVPRVPVVDTKDLRAVPLDATLGPRADGNGPFGDIIGKDFLDNTPRTRLQSAPVYPHEAIRQGLKGEVLVEFVVDESGNVLDPRVVRSSDRVFEEASLRAVAKWKFEAGRKDGRVVRFRMAVPVVFNLND